jgi:DNA-binding NtrC family response regulator
VITAHATLDHAIDAQKSGATAYLNKPLDLRHFEQTLAALLAPALPAEPDVSERRQSAMIGAAPCLREAFIGIARASAGEVPALITGPGGAGKKLAAAVIHAHSPRAGQPLCVVDCAALRDADELIPENCGTLVLDEVVALDPALQTRLAEILLQTGRQGPRVLATTARDAGKALREDLYYALATLAIPLPPLRERSGDIPALCAYFMGLRGDGLAPPVTGPAMVALQAHAWPGNIRELRHVIDYAVTMSRGGPVFISHLPPQLAGADGIAQAAPGEIESVIARWLDAALALPEQQRPDYEALLDRIEAMMLEHLLERHEGKPTRLAAALRIHRATLRQKLRRMGLRGDD